MQITLTAEVERGGEVVGVAHGELGTVKEDLEEHNDIGYIDRN